MTLFDFLTADANMVFSITMLVVLGLFALEFASFVFGMGSASDTLLPDMDHALHLDGAEHLGGGLHADSHAPAWVHMLSWCHVGRVPLLILIAVFLLGFSMTGFIVQHVTWSLSGHLLNAWLAAGVGLVGAFLNVRVVGGLLARILPRDETSAVARTQFVGHTATIVLGQARKGFSAEAKLRDAHGQTHYLRVEPSEDDITFEQGDRVLLVEQHGSVFHAVAAPAATPIA